MIPMTEYGPLLERIAARAREDESMMPLAGLPAPLPRNEIERAELRLGFEPYPLLAAVYRDFGNGGFGPDYQLLSLVNGPTSGHAVDLYLDTRSRNAGTDWAWPEGVLPVLAWGCGMYTCVDCRSDQGTVLFFEPNPGDPDLAWYAEASSLDSWFEGYANRTGWWDTFAEGEEPEMPPWPYSKERASQ